MYGLLEISDSSGCILATDKQEFDISIKNNKLYLYNFLPIPAIRKGAIHGLVIRDPKEKGIIFSFPLDTNIIVDKNHTIYIEPAWVKTYPED